MDENQIVQPVKGQQGFIQKRKCDHVWNLKRRLHAYSIKV